MLKEQIKNLVTEASNEIDFSLEKDELFAFCKQHLDLSSLDADAVQKAFDSAWESGSSSDDFTSGGNDMVVLDFCKNLRKMLTIKGAK